MASPDLDILLRLIDEAYERKAWHGPNLKGSLRGLSPKDAGFRPGPKRHNIWEVAVHAAYWKYAVRRRLRGDKRGSFPLEGSNWFTLPQAASLEAWRSHLALLDDEHRKLREAIAAVRPADLRRKAPGSRVENLTLITGIAAHDVYHAGQIQLLKRLVRAL